MNKRLRTVFQYTFFLGLGIFLVWWSIKDLTADDKAQIRASLKTARYYLVIPVFLILILSHFLRALRWRLLINSLGYNPTKKNAFFAVMIGYLTNQALPRLGEVLKCTVLARYEKIPTEKLIGTIILERMIDALTLLTIFGITLVIQPDIYAELVNAFFHSSPDKQENKISAWLIGFITVGAIILILVLWMLIKKKNIKDLLGLIKNIGKRIWQGISAIQHLKKRGQFILLTVAIWGLYLAGGYIGFFALRETEQYGIHEAFSILSAGSVGMVATPGGIGAYALLIEKTMQVYGLQKGIALAFGWILWLVQTGVILIGGLFSFVALPYFNKTKKVETAG